MAKRASRVRRVAEAARTFIQGSRNVSAEQKALYHQVQGAGRSHVLRPFLGLTPTDESVIQQRLEALIDGVVRRT